LTPTTNNLEAKRYNKAGRSIVSDSWEKDSSYELKVTQEVIDSLGLGLAMNLVPAIAASSTYYDYIEAVVPLIAPFEIPLPGVTTALANGGSVQVSYQASGAWNSFMTGQKKLNMTVLQTGSAADGTAVVTTTTPGTEKLVLHSTQANAPVVISYLRTNTSKLSLGLVDSPSIGSLYFSAKLISDEFPNGLIMICPSVSKSAGLGFKSGDVSPIEHVFTCGTPAGASSSVQLIFL